MSTAGPPDRPINRSLGASAQITMPCLECDDTRTFSAHFLDSEDVCVVYRCIHCGRRIAVEL